MSICLHKTEELLMNNSLVRGEFMLQTHVGFCIDESGSVKSIIVPLVKAYNQTVVDIRDSVLGEGQEASMTALAFGDRVLKHRILYVGQQVQTVTPLKHTDLNPTGMTPLFDSVYRCIKKLEELDDGDESTSFIITTVTDGYENQSVKPGVNVTLELIEEKTKTDRWTFTFLVPTGNQHSFSQKYRIPLGNVQEWDAKTAEGTEKAFVVSSVAYAGYFKERSRGVRSTKSFYADVSDLTVTKARSELSEITKQVKFIRPSETCNIRDCIERAGEQFMKGSGFYHLIKTEKRVQSYKLVALRVKTSKKVYCGQKAREMLGIGAATDTVRLVPGDHGKFDVFIQSTSYNRKIPANTEVLYWPKVGSQKK